MNYDEEFLWDTYLSFRILNRLKFWKIDLEELGVDDPSGEWRSLRRWGGCNCWGTLSPEDETKFWYSTHANHCLKTEKEFRAFESLLGSIILKEGKRFKKEKEEVWTRIKQKIQEVGYKGDVVSEEWIMSRRNKRKLKKTEEDYLKFLEEFKKTDKPNEEEVKKEQEKFKQEQQQKAQAEEAESKKLEEETKQKEQEFKNQVEEEAKKKQEPNQPTTSENKNSNDESVNKDSSNNTDNLPTSEDKSREDEPQEQQEQSNTEELSPKIISKFPPNFNTKEKIESLINPVKDNPKFLQELQTKHQVEDLNALFANKTPKEIIIAIKRFEYDKDKDKKIREYYGFKETESLTDKQINEYLYREAVGELVIAQSKQSPTSKGNQILVPLIISVSIVIGVLVGMVCFVRKKKIDNSKKKNY